MNGLACLALAAAAFVGSHFLMSHPLRAPLVRALGEGPFQGIYSLVALVTFGLMLWAYHAIGREPPLWIASDALWLATSLLMWAGSILFVGSFVRNPAFPGARGPSGAPTGVFAITRHPTGRPSSRSAAALQIRGWSQFSAVPCCFSSRPGCTRWAQASGAGSHNRAKVLPMTRNFFGTDGIRGLTNSEPMTAQTALRVGQAAGTHFLRGVSSAPGGDRQGHAPVGLYDGIGAGRGLHQRRNGCRAAGADADPRGCDAHNLDARRSGSDDLRFAQPVRRQRDQAVRPRRLQAWRSRRNGDRKTLGEAPKLAEPKMIGRARRIDDARGRYVHHAKSTFPERLRLDGLKVVLDCANGAAYHVAPDALWELGAEVVAIGVSRTGSTSMTAAARPIPRLFATAFWRRARISVWRWMAMPIGWSSSMRRDGWSTATR
jgi:hypothetical protein